MMIFKLFEKDRFSRVIGPNLYGPISSIYSSQGPQRNNRANKGSKILGSYNQVTLYLSVKLSVYISISPTRGIINSRRGPKLTKALIDNNSSTRDWKGFSDFSQQSLHKIIKPDRYV